MATKFITVSIEIMHDKNLNQSQKFLLAEIEQLTTLEKGCIASNEHFSKLIGITKENVSRNINDLQKKGYIDIEIVPGTRNHTRIVTLTTLVSRPYQSSKTPLLKQQETKENKTSNKTINTKEVVLLPDWISISAWSQWTQHRKEIGKKLTKSTIELQLKFLAKHKDNHMEIIEQSIQNGWTGLFKLNAIQGKKDSFNISGKDYSDEGEF